MKLRLKRRSHLPLHVQLKAQLAHLIETGSWTAGARLPTVRELAALLRVNRNTAARVFADLERDGYLSCERGRGTFVSPRYQGPGGTRVRELLLLIEEAMGRARRLGFNPGAFAAALYARTHASPESGVWPRRRVLFVECTRPRLRRLRRELAEALPARVDAVLLRGLERRIRRDPRAVEKYLLLVTTSSHLGRVRKLVGRVGGEVVGLPAGDLRIIPGCGATPGSLRRVLRSGPAVVCSHRRAAERVRARAPRGLDILMDDRRFDRAGLEMLRRRLAAPPPAVGRR